MSLGKWKLNHRENRPSRDDWHMLRAITASWRSPDPNTQVGACLVTQDNRPLGEGYNGAPRGMDLYAMPWEREGDWADTKYAYVVHAEKNAILNSSGVTDGASMFCTLYPCNECAKDIVQAGIKEVVYLSNPYITEDFTKVAAWILGQSGIQVRQHVWQNPETIKQHLKTLLEGLTLTMP
jgi:dCMP deaminase